MHYRIITHNIISYRRSYWCMFPPLSHWHISHNHEQRASLQSASGPGSPATNGTIYKSVSISWLIDYMIGERVLATSMQYGNLPALQWIDNRITRDSIQIQQVIHDTNQQMSCNWHSQTFAISTPVIPSTILGSRSTTCRTSVVIFLTPISLDPPETIVIFFACDNGAAISAAIWTHQQVSGSSDNSLRSLGKSPVLPGKATAADNRRVKIYHINGCFLFRPPDIYVGGLRFYQGFFLLLSFFVFAA